MTRSSAPGKVYLFGEHAVVFGEPAVPCAIERRATVTVERRDDDALRVHAADLSIDGFTVEYGGSTGDSPDVDVPTPLITAAVGYVDEAIEQVRDVTGATEEGFEVTIESDIPLGAGLGSSAAVVVAAIDAATRALGVELGPEELADRAFQTERAVQDGEASRSDTYCSTVGGAVRVEGANCHSLGVPDLPLTVGFDGGAGDTGTLVSGVRSLRSEYPFVGDVLNSIGDLVEAGEGALADSDIDELGQLMDVNHGLLSALGVSSRTLDELVWTAREAGAAGAKLTGAGGGGCIVALDPTGATEEALAYSPTCEEAFRAPVASEGVRRLE